MSDILALSEMQQWAQWIIWRADPIPGKPGKSTKRPIDAGNGLPLDAHAPGNWLTYEAADALAASRGLGVGFVFTAKDPFFFVDVDEALQPDGQWSEGGQWAFRCFPGAAFEISHSGRGFHLFGRYTQVPPHSNKRKDLGLELYTDKRFAAVTRNGMHGRALDFTSHLAAFAAHFPPSQTTRAEEWTDTPHPDWGGSLDDGEMLRLILRAKPNFGPGATIPDLWYANVDVLSRVYPADASNPNAEFDHSAADAALCNHLAWWLGNDCERIARFFGMSKLGERDKWQNREQYRRDTILFAVGGCTDFYQGCKPPVNLQAATPIPTVAAVPASPGRIDGAPGLQIVEGYQLYTVADQLRFFAGCVYVADRHQIMLPDGQFMNAERFRAMMGGRIFALDSMNEKTTPNAFLVFTESQALRWPKVRSTRFRPEDPPGALYNRLGIIDPIGTEYVNTYVPCEVLSMPGDPAPLLDLIARLLPDPRDALILLCYMAAIIQYPGVKFQWAPLIQGTEGNGKSFLMAVVAAAVGDRYSHFPNPRDIGNVFNGWLVSKLFIGIQDIWADGDPRVIEALKPLITDSRVDVQPKGKDQATGDNRANFILNSNHRDAMRITANDRRYCPFYCAQQTVADLEVWGLSGDYFPQLYRWAETGGFAILTNFLREYKIAEEFNPATKCHRAPRTSTTLQAIEASRNTIEQVIQEAINSEMIGFRGGWVSTLWLGELWLGSRGTNPRKRAEALETLGYVPHPKLPDGRCTISIACDQGRKPRLYCKPDSIQWHMSATQAMDAYIKAQLNLTADGMPQPGEHHGA